MTTPSGTISMANVASELGVSATGINLNQTNVRRLAGVLSGTISMSNLQNKTWVLNLAGVQSVAGCYAAQSGFSVDRYGSAGDVILTTGVWPSYSPQCNTCAWQWLQFGAAENTNRINTGAEPYWAMIGPQVNITGMSIGQTIYIQVPYWPYTLVGYTFAVTRTAINSVGIVPFPYSWSTGDTGTSISVYYWWYYAVLLGGGNPDPENPTLGQINLTWTNLGY